MIKTIIFIIALIAGIFGLANAQAFQKGSNIVSAGIGLGSSLLSYSGANQTPAINLQYERGVWLLGSAGVVSLGGYAGYKGYNYTGSDGDFKWSDKWTYTVLGVRSAYHYTGLSSHNKLDVYGGAMLSYNLVSYKYADNGGNTSGLLGKGSYGSNAGFTAYVGGRYYFTQKVAGMAELGYGVSYLTLGASFKL